MANKLAIVVGSVSLVIIALLLFHGHSLKRSLKENQEDLADEKVRSKRSQRQNLDYESRIRDLEVALRQKTEQQNSVQGELEEAQQEVQENTDFMKEVQQALEQMAIRFNIAIDAEETIATTVIQQLGDRLQETISNLRNEITSANEQANQHAAAVDNASEHTKELETALAAANKKADDLVKDLTAVRGEYKKLAAVVSAALLSAENTSATDVKAQQAAIDAQTKAIDAKIKAAAATAAPPTKPPQPPAPAPVAADAADEDENNNDGNVIDDGNKQDDVYQTNAEAAEAAEAAENHSPAASTGDGAPTKDDGKAYGSSTGQAQAKGGKKKATESY